jgi:adenylate cyclase
MIQKTPKTSIRLRPSIVLLFVILVVPIFTAMLWFTYTTNDRMTRSNAKDLMERFRFEAIANTNDLLVPIESLVSTAAVLASGQPSYFRQEQAFAYLQNIAAHSTTISSAYAGFEDGTFRMVMRTSSTTRIQDKLVPEGSVLAYRWLDRAKPKIEAQDQFTFKDKQGQVLGALQSTATYDPRQRDWYKRAAIEQKVTLSEPYVFASTGLPGITIAAPFMSGGKLAGVVAVDITLDGLSQFLATRKISSGAISLMVDDKAQVIANSNVQEQALKVNGKLELRSMTKLSSDLPALALANQYKASNKDNFSFSHPQSGEEYVVSFASLAARFDKHWQIMLVAPLDDFAGPLKENNKRLLIFGLIAIALQVLFIYFLSRLIAKPLERLEDKINNVRSLSTETVHASNGSSIREIGSLIRAVDMLDHAVRSFAAFVPVGLVRQLMESEQQLTLGGQSKFLTMLFCDVEAFSSLAENSPSQELLIRVSRYLEEVTLAVNEEGGTIDKFIGDAAMAFWGAPAPLADHAWHACAAAVRIQAKMAVLNAQWQAEGLEPLKVRIGIHCDAVMVGNIGSKHRMSYTVMGDGVNIASRLEAINKDYGTSICISQAVYREAGERLDVRRLDEVAVKGRQGKIVIYELLGLKESERAHTQAAWTMGA